MKRRIRLTENDLRNIVKMSAKRVINEMMRFENSDVMKMTFQEWLDSSPDEETYYERENALKDMLQSLGDEAMDYHNQSHGTVNGEDWSSSYANSEWLGRDGNADFATRVNKDRFGF
jgi:uncharacterized protein involved in tellurium resistance